MGKMIRCRRSNQGEPRRMPLNYKFVSDSLIFPLSVPQENERSAQAFAFRTVFCASKCKDVTYYFCKKHVRPVLRWCLQYRSRWEMTIDIIVLQSHNQCSPLLYDITNQEESHLLGSFCSAEHFVTCFRLCGYECDTQLTFISSTFNSLTSH